MSNPVDTLEGKIEYALVAVLSDADLEDVATPYCGHEFEEAEGNQIIVSATRGEEMVYNSGNYLCEATIRVRTRADRRLATETTVADPREVHRAILQRIRSAIEIADICDTMTEHEEDFTCNNIWPGITTTTKNGRYFESEISYNVDAVRADFV